MPLRRMNDGPKMFKSEYSRRADVGVRPALAAVFTGFAALSFSAPLHAEEPASAPPEDSFTAAAFDQMKALEGTWQVADREDHPLRIRFYPTARGATLVESWEVEGRSHSLTLYHRNGDKLLATHYCPQGNQPRMDMVPDADGAITFSFRDVTDYDPAGEQHQHDLSFDLSNADRIIRSEHYLDGDGNLHPSSLVLTRVSPEKAIGTR